MASTLESDKLEREIEDTSRTLAQMMAQLTCENPFDEAALGKFQEILLAQECGAQRCEVHEGAEHALDRLIELQSERVAMLKRLKAILLEKMLA